jgi:hypothetical protein
VSYTFLSFFHASAPSKSRVVRPPKGPVTSVSSQYIV